MIKKIKSKWVFPAVALLFTVFGIQTALAWEEYPSNPVYDPVVSAEKAYYPSVLKIGAGGYRMWYQSNSSPSNATIAGENRFCVITNDDIGAPVAVPPVPPLIDVVKVSNPLPLPSGPGPVTYTYTLRNIGTVPVADITMVGDTCSPISLISGDANGDARLDINGTWVDTCGTTLTETHTNTVTTTGWANGLSAVDITGATVVVGTPGLPETGRVVPPLSHVTEVPSPVVLPTEGGMVIYVNNVTDPGIVPLSNIRLATSITSMS